MSARTNFLSRLIGLYCILVALSMFAHKQATVEMVRELVHNAPLMYFAGIMAVVAGLAMVLSHNVWSGGALSVVVTVIGWLSLIKGALILFLSPEAEAGVILDGPHYDKFFYFYAAFSLFLGIYLIYAGARSKAG